MKNEEVKKVEETNADGKEVLPKKRQIVIETDGSSANIVTAEVAGAFELIGILETIIKTVRK